MVSHNSELKNKINFPIIALGSSAGGLNALEEFFDHCPETTGFAFVIVQHLSPDYKSLMPELLSRHTKMEVTEARNNEKIVPNHVYLIPGDKNITLKNGLLCLSDRPSEHQINFSIDIFFKSLAVEQKRKAICVILSGTGSDGTKGAKAIKEVGGILLVQDPQTAKFDGMPRSAIEHGLADFILPAKEMPKELIDYVDYDSLDAEFLANDKGALEALNKILKMIKNFVGYDFLEYKHPTLFRRTAKRMSITKSSTVEEYINYLYEHPEEKFLLTQEFLIGVTKFFRDTEAFEELKQKVIPQIALAKKESKDPIKVWVVACSTGEEAYSIAMLLEEYCEAIKQKANYKIFATDINEKAIDIASKGMYRQNIETEVPSFLLDKYFTKEQGGYLIKQTIRSKIIFSRHDVLQNPPFNKMDLVTCRNMLIYMGSDIQQKVLTSIHFSLNENGFLFLGNSESLGNLDQNFEEINVKWKIYRNLKSGKLNVNFNNEIWKVSKKVSESKVQRNTENAFDKMIRAINTTLMEDLGVVCACIDENYEIVHASGRLKDYIEFPDEGFTNNLVKMLPDEVGIPLGASIRKITKSKEDLLETRLIKVLREDKLQELRIMVRELKMGSSRRSFLVVFCEQKSSSVDLTQMDQKNKLSIDSPDVTELMEALTETRENLRSTIEELETTNEEMQATNEELMASNEELQSTNEELQSLNEELHTVNAEMQQKNTQLLESNSDIENLMKNVHIGTVFLDRNFNIRKFTPAIHQHFQLRVEDIGRPINHFTGTLGKDLMKRSEEVITTLQSYKEEVQNAEGTWFLMQIFPYRNQEHIIKGVVINFINIDETKAAIQETAQVNDFLKNIIDANPGIIYIYDLENNQNVYASDNIAKIAGYSEEEVLGLGSSIMQVLFYEEDLPRIAEHHRNMLSLADGEMLQLEYRIVHKKTKDPIWILSTDKVYERNDKGKVVTILGVAQNINAAKGLQDKLKESESRLQLAIKGNRAALWEWSDFATNNAWWSPEFYELLEYSPRTLKSVFSAFINLIHPEDIVGFRKNLEEHVEDLQGLNMEIRIKTKNSGYKWFRVNANAQIERNGEIKKIVGTIIDIDNKKQSENKMKKLNIELERFAYLASHDLKEPLRTVTSFTRLFREEYGNGLDENANVYLDFVENASSRMITLTNDLLQYSQLDDKSLNFEKVDLQQEVKDILEDLHQTITENEAQILVDKLPKIYCDAIQIRQLFQNLISNSLKYRKSDVSPIINIGFEEKRNDFQFYVKDNGIGISKEYHDKIFEVFKRLHSHEEYEGTGIGLANCKRIVDNHQGKIWLKSIPGEGSTFYFSITKLKPKKKNEKDKLHSISG